MKVFFHTEGSVPVAIECNRGDNLLEVAHRANVIIETPCAGTGYCGKCRVKLLEGQLDSPRSEHITRHEWDEGWRLACESAVVSDCVIEVPDMALVYQDHIMVSDVTMPGETVEFVEARARLEKWGVSFGNGFRVMVLDLAKPSEEDVLPDVERMTRAIQEQLGPVSVKVPFNVMGKLARTLREHDFCISIKGELKDNVFTCMGICSPRNTAMVGCAIDVGTTTVAMVLTDLATGKILARGGSSNKQIRYGADVINRIIEQGHRGGKKTLQEAIVRETLTPMIMKLCRLAGVSARSIMRISIGANTTMNHLLVGVDADPVRTPPFVPSFYHWDGLLAGDLHLPTNPLAPVIVAPNVGSYVGGDITAGMLVMGMWQKEEISLFVDLGTNGEIVCGNQDLLISCACAAGPAFEGGNISCGMRATDGAIEAVSIDKATGEPTLSVIGGENQKPVGICGSGVIDVVAQLFLAGFVNAGGHFIREHARVKYDEKGQGRYILSDAASSGTGRELAFTEEDIDNFLRAKGAIFSAIYTLLQSIDVTPDMLDRVYVAGGIGSKLNMHSAVTIGMLPDVPLDHFTYVGNSSLYGAYALTLSDEAVAKTDAIASEMTYLQLSTYPNYKETFTAACFIPHTDKTLFPSVFQE